MLSLTSQKCPTNYNDEDFSLPTYISGGIRTDDVDFGRVVKYNAHIASKDTTVAINIYNDAPF